MSYEQQPILPGVPVGTTHIDMSPKGISSEYVGGIPGFNRNDNYQYPSFGLWGPFNNLGTAPQKKDYPKEIEWIRASVLYCLLTAAKHSQRLAMSKLSLDMVNRLTRTTKDPGYSNRPSPDKPSGGVRYATSNALSKIVDTMSGEFAMQKSTIEAEIMNEYARSQRERDKANAIMSGVMYVADEDPVQLSMAQAMGEVEGSQEEFFDKNYRNKYAEAGVRMFKEWSIQDFDGIGGHLPWEQWMQQTRDLFLITETAYCSPYIDPVTLDVICPLIHPLDAVPDPNCSDDFLLGARFFVRYRYVSIESLKGKYKDLDLEELNKYRNVPTVFMNMPVYRQNEAGTYQVLVVNARFLYVEPKRVNFEQLEITDDQEGDVLGDVRSKKSEVITNWEELYEAEMIGGYYISHYGKVENQLRSVDRVFKSSLQTVQLIHNYHRSTTAPNTLLRVAPLLDERDQLVNKRKELIMSMRGPIIGVDWAQIPPHKEGPEAGWKRLVQQMVSNRIALIGQPGFSGQVPTGPAFQPVNMDANPEIILHINALIADIDRQIENIIGFNEQRLGATSQYETTGVAKQNLNASLNTTASRYDAIDRFFNASATLIVRLLVVSLQLKKERYMKNNNVLGIERLQMTLGDEAFALAEELGSMDLAIRFKNKYNAPQRMEQLRQNIAMILGQKAAEFDPKAIAAFLRVTTKMEDPDDAVDYITQYFDAAAKEQAAKEQQMAEKQMMMQAELQNQQLQGKAALQQQGADNKLAEMALQGAMQPPQNMGGVPA